MKNFFTGFFLVGSIVFGAITALSLFIYLVGPLIMKLPPPVGVALLVGTILTVVFGGIFGATIGQQFNEWKAAR